MFVGLEGEESAYQSVTIVLSALENSTERDIWSFMFSSNILKKDHLAVISVARNSKLDIVLIFI